MSETRASLLSLSAAAAIAYARLAKLEAGQPRECADGLLDVVAIALATCLPVYTGEPRRRISDDELARGRFRLGATVLQFLDRTPPLENLTVGRAELEQAIARLERAGVSFSEAWHEQAPRRLPRVSPK